MIQVQCFSNDETKENDRERWSIWVVAEEKKKNHICNTFHLYINAKRKQKNMYYFKLRYITLNVLNVYIKTLKTSM